MSEQTRQSRNHRENGGVTKNGKPKKKRKIFKRIILTHVGLGVAGVIAGAGLFFYYAKDAPALDLTKLSDSIGTRFFDQDGTLIDELGSQTRIQLKPSQAPTVLKDAVVSIEDKRFYSHFGIDPIRIVGSALANVKAGGVAAGGSTITQQLIKLSFFSTKQSDQTLRRKAQEALLAVKLERALSKEEILTLYINKVYMANGVYGMGTAAKTYFGKDAADLTLAQATLLAGIPNSPNNFDPYSHPDAAKERRDIVLGTMLNNKKITKDDYNKAVATKVNDGLIALSTADDNRKVLDNYLTSAINEIKTKTGKDAFTEGMDVYLNINLEQQKNLYNLVNGDSDIEFPDDALQVATTVTDPTTGAVIAQIGGRKIADNVQFGMNRATNAGTAGRDVGSTMKPLIDYGPAIEYKNYSTAKVINDEPYKYPGTNITVKNADRRYLGNISLRYALTDSRNVPAVKTLMDVGVDKAAEFLGKLGIKLPKIEGSSAISGPLSTEQLAGGYGAFANTGIYSKPYYVNRLVFQDGTEVKYSPESSQAMKETTAYMITDVLKDVIKDGTGVTAEISGLYQAGKTGTSNYDEADADKITGDADNGSPDVTFVGYTKNYVVAVWTGYDDYYHAIPVSSHSIAAKIYKNTMAKLAADVSNSDWKMPDGLVRSGGELYLEDYYEAPKESKSSSSSTSSTTSSSTTSSSTSTTSSSVPESSVEVPESSSSSEPTEVTPPASSSEPATDQSQAPTTPAPAADAVPAKKTE